MYTALRVASHIDYRLVFKYLYSLSLYRVIFVRNFYIVVVICITELRVVGSSIQQACFNAKDRIRPTSWAAKASFVSCALITSDVIS